MGTTTTNTNVVILRLESIILNYHCQRGLMQSSTEQVEQQQVGWETRSSLLPTLWAILKPTGLFSSGFLTNTTCFLTQNLPGFVSGHSPNLFCQEKMFETYLNWPLPTCDSARCGQIKRCFLPQRHWGIVSFLEEEKRKFLEEHWKSWDSPTFSYWPSHIDPTPFLCKRSKRVLGEKAHCSQVKVSPISKTYGEKSSRDLIWSFHDFAVGLVTFDVLILQGIPTW